MRRAQRRARGLTLFEVAVSSILGAIILGGSTILLTASDELARSADRSHAAQTRADRVLWPVARHLRRGSLATAQKIDGSAFADGQTAAGFSIAQVIGWNGAPVLGERVEYAYVRPAGETLGIVELRLPTGTSVIARNVSEFSVTRVGTQFSLNIQTAAGPDDDRRRIHNGVVAAAPRSP